MDFDAVPPLAVPESDAVRHVLARAGVLHGSMRVPYDSAWRQAAVDEATDGFEHTSPGALPPYTPSPRSTRGATRA